MHTVNRSTLVSELPPIQLDMGSIEPIGSFLTGKLVAIEEAVEIGRFYDILNIESSHGVGRLAMPAGFCKANGFEVGTVLGYYETENQWFDLGTIEANVNQGS